MIKEAKCPRWGFIKLTAASGREYVKGTVCKTWSCPICRSKQLSMFRMRIKYGCSKDEHSFLITLTLRADQELRFKDARFVARAWAGLLRNLRARSPKLRWIRVIELTEKKTPHIHLIVNGLGPRLDSCQRDKEYKHFSEVRAKSLCGKDCVEHEWTGFWFGETTAFVVDVRSVFDAGGAGAYLGKYLSKGFGDRKELEALGFFRRWSCSRNWPRELPIKLRGSLGDGWERTEIIPRYFRKEEMKEREKRDAGAYLMERQGEDFSLMMRDEAKAKSQKKQIERWQRYVDAPIQAPTDPGRSDGRDR